MGIKTILFLLGFVMASGGALFVPLWGVLGYVAHYNIGPEDMWWAVPLRHYGIRYSYILALATAFGMGLNWQKLRFGKPLLAGQEIMILLFLGLVWLLLPLSEPTAAEQYSIVDHPTIKLIKIVIFALMMSHIVTTMRRVEIFFWVLIAGAMLLGYKAYTTPYSSFVAGRLETIGGPDFRASNNLAVYLAILIPIIGIQFLNCGWKGKLFCLVSGAFAVNAIILTRSRGALVGIAAGMVATLILAPRKHQAKITVALVLALIGGIYLTDTAFWTRAGTITASGEERDSSAQSRLEIWKGGMEMLMAHPQGVGAGNFPQEIGNYAPRHHNRDAHSTYVLCAGELGLVGIGLLTALLINCLRILVRIRRQSRQLQKPDQERVLLMGHGLLVSLVITAACGLTGSLIYIESFWWFLVLPVCLNRALENLQEDSKIQPEMVTSSVGRKRRKPFSAGHRRLRGTISKPEE